MRTLIALSLIVASPASVFAADMPKPLKVFILAGQSNMEGKAKMSLVEYQADQPGTRDLFKHWRKDGKWIERDDVWIKFLDR
jgi:alpha-galactosidase